MSFTFDIAVGRSRKDAQWPSRPTTWEDFCDRCATTKRTRETVEQYASFSRDAQGDIKDVGGFVGATLNGGKRRKSAVASRTAITLDLDYAESAEDVWERIRRNAPDSAALVYSTHKHTAEHPRLRVVFPYKRPVPADIYEAVARIWADYLGILDMCDPTTFETSRLFYWPSTSKDGEYFFRCNRDGDPLDASKVLELYKPIGTYTDCRNWPMGKHESTEPTFAASSPMGGQAPEDPRRKDGIIGAFCRAHYPIEAAIRELLADKYEPCHDRFTYREGSTSAGVVCVDGLWAFSRHATDPAEGQMCNIFDLVRIHRFGDLDARSRQEGEKLPSFQKMRDWAFADPATKAVMLGDAVADFEGFGSDEEPRDEKNADEDAWMGKLTMNKRGEIEQTAANIETIMENDPKLKGLVRYNVMTDCVHKSRQPFWASKDGRWTDTDEACLRVYLEKRYKIAGRDRIADVLVAVAFKRQYHPICEYLDSLPKWDGVPRVATLMSDYLGAEDCELNREMTRLIFAAAVARVRQPGAKFDHCMILCGAEGIGKSTLIATMGGEWYTDSVYTFKGKEAMEQIQGRWLVELGELQAVKRSEIDEVKSFISSTEDEFRPAYGRHKSAQGRQCVFFGTTNEDKFLKGLDGNRKFWIMPLTGEPTKSLGELRLERDQIWAEAKEKYDPGEMLCLPRELEMQARRRTKDFNEDEDNDQMLEGVLREFLDMELPGGWETYDLAQRRAHLYKPEICMYTKLRDRFSIAEFVCEKLGIDLGGDAYKYKARQIGRIMKRIDEWQPIASTRHASKVYGIQKGYKRVKPPKGYVDDDDL